MSDDRLRASNEEGRRGVEEEEAVRARCGAARRGDARARCTARCEDVCIFFETRRNETPRRRRENRFESDQSGDACAWIQFDHML